MAQNINIRKFVGFAALAGLINSVIFLLAKSAGATMVINQGGLREIELARVLGATFFGLVAAGFFVSLIGRKLPGFVSKSPLIGLSVAVATAALPLFGAADSKTALAVPALHIVAGLTWYLSAKRSIK